MVASQNLLPASRLYCRRYGEFVGCWTDLRGFGEGTLYELRRPSKITEEMKLGVILFSEAKFCVDKLYN